LGLTIGDELAVFRQARIGGRGGKGKGDYRSPFERDRDRILYSTAFRRLGSVTQVVAVRETHLFHNRLTHSLKVAQVGAGLARKLLRTSDESAIQSAGGINESVVEAAGLAHDLGHPPFGHIAETELRHLLEAEPVDSFEGNAQSFRIVTKLAFRKIEPRTALDLTRATLRALLKYPWLRGDAPDAYRKGKWGAYRSEQSHFDFATESAKASVPSVEAKLMDWADDITYAVHDAEDFYRAGLIPFDRLAHETREADVFIDWATTALVGEGFTKQGCEAAFAWLQEVVFPTVPYTGGLEDQAFLSEMVSSLITRYIAAVSLGQDGSLRISDTERHEIGVLKKLTWYYVIDSPSLTTLQIGQREVIRKLFTVLRQSASAALTSPRERSRLPIPFRELINAIRTDEGAIAFAAGNDEVLSAIAAVDYITSLTEDQATNLHDRLIGRSTGSALEPWLRS
jgi:dGTPase